jgi:MFS transporter, PHS family, inorganic phosphate transporter
VFGWAADRLGRKKMYGIELIILVASTLGQALSSPSPTVTIVELLIFGRTVMGLGIGGDCPMSAVITSE